MSNASRPPRRTPSRGRTPEQTVFRGINWYRDQQGQISFFDPNSERWVPWKPGVDAPPRPTGWGGGFVRPRWTSGWRLVPVVLTVVVVLIAVFQALHSSSDQTLKETKAAEALLGKCLAESGTALGHPKYSSTPVPCTSERAAVKVVKVVPSIPGSPSCPAGTTPFELPYSGVKFLHVLCLRPVPPAGQPQGP